MEYSYYNCPDEPDTGGVPQCGAHAECKRCDWYYIVRDEDNAKQTNEK